MQDRKIIVHGLCGLPYVLFYGVMNSRFPFFIIFFFLTAPVLHSIHGLHSVCSFTSNLRNLKVFYLHFESALCTDFIFGLCRVSIRANAVIWMLLVTSLIEQALHIFSLHEQKAALAGNDRPKACSRHSGLQI